MSGFGRSSARSSGARTPGVRTALVSIPRANGKTALAAMLRLAEMSIGPPSAEVLILATDQRQAELTLKLARRMVELSPVREGRMHVFRDRLYPLENDATQLPLAAEPGALHGHDPSLLIVDELQGPPEPALLRSAIGPGTRLVS